eukprot:PhF_6_TR36502/c0_g2_i4/m.53698
MSLNPTEDERLTILSRKTEIMVKLSKGTSALSQTLREELQKELSTLNQRLKELQQEVSCVLPSTSNERLIGVHDEEASLREEQRRRRAFAVIRERHKDTLIQDYEEQDMFEKNLREAVLEGDVVRFVNLWKKKEVGKPSTFVITKSHIERTLELFTSGLGVTTEEMKHLAGELGFETANDIMIHQPNDLKMGVLQKQCEEYERFQHLSLADQQHEVRTKMNQKDGGGDVVWSRLQLRIRNALLSSDGRGKVSKPPIIPNTPRVRAILQSKAKKSNTETSTTKLPILGPPCALCRPSPQPPHSPAPPPRTAPHKHNNQQEKYRIPQYGVLTFRHRKPKPPRSCHIVLCKPNLSVTSPTRTRDGGGGGLMMPSLDPSIMLMLSGSHNVSDWIAAVHRKELELNL